MKGLADQRDISLNRKNPVGLIRFILERPFVNTAIVFAALVAIGTTTHRSYTSLNASVEGSSLDHSNLLTLGFLGQMHFIFALMASSALPVLIQMGLSLKRRSQLVSAFGLLSISIFFIFNYLNFSADNFSLNTGAVNFLLCFVALSFIILGSLWSAPIGMYVFLGLPLMFGVYYASSGLLLGDGRDGFTTSKFLITNLIVMSLLTVSVNLALGNLQSGVAKYRDEMGIVLGRLFINGLMISLLMGAIWVLIPSSIHSSDADLIVKTHMTLGLKLGLVASLSVLFFIPGFLFLMMERKVSQNLDDSQGEIAFAGSHQEFLLGYERFWRTMRKIFPLPSSYGVMFVLAISAIVIQVKMLPVVYIEDYYLTIMATLIGAIGLLSLRAFIMMLRSVFEISVFSINTRLILLKNICGL